MPTVPVIYSAIGWFTLAQEFENFATTATDAASAADGPNDPLTQKHRNNRQLRLELHPLICAYGEHICSSRPLVEQILSMLISKRLEPLMAQLKPLLQVQRTWNAASALLRGSGYECDYWSGPCDSDGKSTSIDQARHYKQLYVDPVSLSKQALQGAVIFLDRELDHAPRNLRRSEEAIEQLRREFGATLVAACAAFLDSEEGSRPRNLPEQPEEGYFYWPPCKLPRRKAKSVWDVVGEDCRLDRRCSHGLSFAYAFPEHWFLCPKLCRDCKRDTGKLDSDACMCALAAVNGNIDLGQSEGDVKVLPEAVHERAGLLFGGGQNCTLALERVPALVQWRVDCDEEEKDMETVVWARGKNATVSV